MISSKFIINVHSLLKAALYFGGHDLLPTFNHLPTPYATNPVQLVWTARAKRLSSMKQTLRLLSGRFPPLTCLTEPQVLTGLQIYKSDVIVFVILKVFKISIINKGLVLNWMAPQ